MKKIVLFAALMVATLTANAQNEVGQITLKPMAGINLATMTSLDDSKMRVGLVAGAEAEYGIAENFSITAGLLYSMQGAKGKRSLNVDNFGVVNTDITAKYDYLNIPILANYYVTKGLALKAGIQPGFKVSSKLKAEYSAGGQSLSVEETDDDVAGFNLAIPLGISYEYQNFVFDARYNLGVTKVYKDNGDKTPKHSVFMFTLGYKFAL